jgi:hypothetical protein
LFSAEMILDLWPWLLQALSSGDPNKLPINKKYTCKKKLESEYD